MKQKPKARGMLNRALENPAFRKRFEEGYAAFKLEVQILSAMERRGWSYSDLARALHTQRSNISRDLSGRINSATVSRLIRIGEALDLTFVPLFVPKTAGKKILPRIEKLISV